MDRPLPANGEIYHVYNRGVEKRDVFLNDRDYLRFIHDLFEFNDQEAASNTAYFFKHKTQSMEVKLPYITQRKVREPRKLLVEIQAFCLMPNHFHLMIRQLVKNGIPDFMRKIGTGYTNSFNKKYERVGALFQGTYKSALIKNESHFLYLPFYIHLNPLDIKMPEWREGKLKNVKAAIKYLENYRWSSFLDYIGKKNFPSVTQRDFLLEFFDGPAAYKKEIIRWLKETNLEEISHFTLEPIYGS